MSSSEIIRMLNSAFDSIGALPGDYYPEALRPEIDAGLSTDTSKPGGAWRRVGLRRELLTRRAPRRMRPEKRPSSRCCCPWVCPPWGQLRAARAVRQCEGRAARTSPSLAAPAAFNVGPAAPARRTARRDESG